MMLRIETVEDLCHNRPQISDSLCVLFAVQHWAHDGKMLLGKAVFIQALSQ